MVLVIVYTAFSKITFPLRTAKDETLQDHFTVGRSDQNL